MQGKKKILILIDWFTPGYRAGGPVQSCRNLCMAIGSDYDIFVLTTDTDHGENQPYQGIETEAWVIHEQLNCRIKYLSKRTLNSRKVIREIKMLRPDFVYLNHLFSPYFVIAPLFYRMLTKSTATWVVCPRGALFPSALNHKRYKKVPVMWLYRFFRLPAKVVFHATTIDEARLIEQYFSSPAIRLAGNIPDSRQPTFQPVVKEPNTLRCLYVARIVPIKNLCFLLDILSSVNRAFRVSLDIIGPKEDSDYWNTSMDKIRKLPPHIDVTDLGPLPASEIAVHLFNSHLYVLPTQGENFGHSIFNALLHGRPVLISNRTPWRNLPVKQAGWDLPLDRLDDFVGIIESLAVSTQEQYDAWAHGAWVMARDHIQSAGWKQEYQSLFS